MNNTETSANANNNNVNPLVVALAADVYAARQLRISNPTGNFSGGTAKRFYLSREEYGFVPEDRREKLRPSNRFPFKLLNYARSKQHVALMFGVPVEALAAEVKARNIKRRKREAKASAASENN